VCGIWLVFRLDGKQEGDLKAQAPGGSTWRANGVAVELNADVHGLSAQAHDAAKAAAEGNSPTIRVGYLPVRGEGGLPGDVVALGQVVIDEILQKKLIHVLA